MENKLNLIGTLRDYCIENNIYFIPGPQDYVNAVADNSIYSAYDLVLIASLLFEPIFGDNSLESVTYTGTIALGRKREETTVSSLDETFEQKYDRRLLDLSEELVSILQELSCKEDIEITRCQIAYQINQYDLNLDLVSANIEMSI